MKRDAANAAVSGVLDAGVILVRLDPAHRSHKSVSNLLDACSRGNSSLFMSVVNVAEVIEHARGYVRRTGLDIVTLLGSYRAALHSPDAETARRAGEMAAIHDLSLADRFALATSELTKSRLYTTDHPLAAAARRRHLPVTLFER